MTFMPLLSPREGIEVYIGNALTLGVINFVTIKDATLWLGNIGLIVGTLIFTYYKIRKMRAEALRAEREAEDTTKPQTNPL